jgi:hypothetical protein
MVVDNQDCSHAPYGPSWTINAFTNREKSLGLWPATVHKSQCERRDAIRTHLEVLLFVEI